MSDETFLVDKWKKIFIYFREVIFAREINESDDAVIDKIDIIYNDLLNGKASTITESVDYPGFICCNDVYRTSGNEVYTIQFICGIPEGFKYNPLLLHILKYPSNIKENYRDFFLSRKIRRNFLLEGEECPCGKNNNKWNVKICSSANDNVKRNNKMILAVSCAAGCNEGQSEQLILNYMKELENTEKQKPNRIKYQTKM